MPIDLLALATTAVTTFLAPYAKSGLEKLATAFTEHLGAQAADYASQLTGKVWGLVTGAMQTPKEQSTLELFRENPDEMQAMLIKQLHEKLRQDAALAQSLDELIHQPGPDGVTNGAQIMQAGIAGIVDLRNANLSQAQNLNIFGVNLGNQPASHSPSNG